MVEQLRTVTTNSLRSNLSEIVNLAAYGGAPVVVTRRGLKVAAIVSIADLPFFMRMQKKREELRRRPFPSDTQEVGRELGERLKEEMYLES